MLTLSVHAMTLFQHLARRPRERGASLVEYVLLVSLIALVCFAAVTLLGKNVSSKYGSVGSSLA
jgi:pilus assembly protein Flp/PilA